MQTELVTLLDRETDDVMAVVTIEEALKRDDLKDVMIGRIEGTLEEMDFTWENGFSDRWDTRQALEAFTLIIKLSHMTHRDPSCFTWHHDEITYNPYETYGIEEGDEDDDFIKDCEMMDGIAYTTCGDYDDYRKVYSWVV